MDERHVIDGLTSTHNMLNVMNMGQLGPMPESFPARQPGAVYALAGSCACCERDETAGGRADLKKCSKCKLTRCGPRFSGRIRGSGRANDLLPVCVLWLIRVDTAGARASCCATSMLIFDGPFLQGRVSEEGLAAAQSHLWKDLFCEF